MAEKQKNKNRKIGRSQRNGQAARYRVSLQRERNKAALTASKKYEPFHAGLKT